MADAVPPPRPQLAPLFVWGVALWIGTGAALSFLRTNHALVLAFALVGGAVLAVSVMLALRHRKANVVFLLTAGLALGMLLGSANAEALHARAASFAQSDMSTGIAVLDEDARPSTFGSSATATLHLDTGASVKVGLLFPPSSSAHATAAPHYPPRYGDVIVCHFTASDPSFETSDRWWNKGAACVLKVTSFRIASDQDLGEGALRAALLKTRNAAIDGFAELESTAADALFASPDVARTLCALACGHRGSLTGSALYGSFKKCGIAHLIAVSGAHLVIVVALMNALLKPLPLSRRTVIFIDVAVMLSYLLLAGFPVSALRATLMAAATLTAFFSRRRPSSLNALGACVVVIITLDATASLSVSLLLSFCSTAGIVLFSPSIAHFLETHAPRVPAFAAEACALTVASNIVCLPVSCALFSQLPLITLVANVACCPLFPPVCALALVSGLAFAFAPALSAVIAVPACAAAAALCQLVGLLAGVPFSCVPVYVPTLAGYAAALVVPFALWIA